MSPVITTFGAYISGGVLPSMFLYQTPRYRVLKDYSVAQSIIILVASATEYFVQLRYIEYQQGNNETIRTPYTIS